MNEKMPSRSGPVSLLVVAIILTLGPVWGLLGTAVEMILLFGKLQSGNPSVEAPVTHMDTYLGMTALGMVMSPIGIALLVVAIIWIVKVNQKRKKLSNQ